MEGSQALPFCSSGNRTLQIKISGGDKRSPKINLIYTQKFSSHRAVDTHRLDYKNQSVNAV
jgi:hypothetical protein